MLLPVETDAILEKKYCKKYAVRFFCSGNSEMVFILLTKVVAGHMVVIIINIQKICLKGPFLRAFCSCQPGFYYCLNDLLHLFIQINSWQGSDIGKRCCQCVGRPLGHCRYVKRPQEWNLSAGKFVWASERRRQSRRGRVNRLRDITLDSTRVSASFKSHQKEWKGFEEFQRSKLMLSKRAG